MSGLDERVFEAADLPRSERLAGLRMVLMTERGAAVANAVEVTADEVNRMNAAADYHLERAPYIAPEIRASTVWIPLLKALLSAGHRAALEAVGALPS